MAGRAKAGAGSADVILVDSDIPMYLVGAEHPLKVAARTPLERAITDGEVLVTDTEVLEEILHRYVAIDRRDPARGRYATAIEVPSQPVSITGGRNSVCRTTQ